MVSARTLRRHRRQCQPRDAVPKGTVSHRISRWCIGRIQLVDTTPRYFGGVRWGTGSSSWRFVAIGVRFPRRDGRRWPGGRTGGRGGGRCGGDDGGCSRRCRRVVAGWFSVVPPCWRRESTTARDGFGVATCPQMSAERISSPSDCASAATRDAVACARSRRISACAATASSSVIIASFGGGAGGPNRPESSPHGSPEGPQKIALVVKRSRRPSRIGASGRKPISQRFRILPASPPVSA